MLPVENVWRLECGGATKFECLPTVFILRYPISTAEESELDFQGHVLRVFVALAQSTISLEEVSIGGVRGVLPFYSY